VGLRHLCSYTSAARWPQASPRLSDLVQSSIPLFSRGRCRLHPFPACLWSTLVFSFAQSGLSSCCGAPLGWQIIGLEAINQDTGGTDHAVWTGAVHTAWESIAHPVGKGYKTTVTISSLRENLVCSRVALTQGCTVVTAPLSCWNGGRCGLMALGA
jgi:hypothetical protein